MDQELLEMFIEEVGELKNELKPICQKLEENNQQPLLFGQFSQIIDRIYGTATTMGFRDIGEYIGVVRNLTRQTSSSNIPRGMQEVSKIVRTCMSNFEIMQKSLQDPEAAKEFSFKLNLEVKKINKIQKEIFSYSRDAKTDIAAQKKT